MFPFLRLDHLFLTEKSENVCCCKSDWKACLGPHVFKYYCILTKTLLVVLREYLSLCFLDIVLLCLHISESR